MSTVPVEMMNFFTPLDLRCNNWSIDNVNISAAVLPLNRSRFRSQPLAMIADCVALSLTTAFRVLSEIKATAGIFGAAFCVLCLGTAVGLAC